KLSGSSSRRRYGSATKANASSGEALMKIEAVAVGSERPPPPTPPPFHGGEGYPIDRAGFRLPPPPPARGGPGGGAVSPSASTPPITPRSAISASRSSETPALRSTSAVCSPGRAEPRSGPPGVRESLTGEPETLSEPPFQVGSSTTI